MIKFTLHQRDGSKTVLKIDKEKIVVQHFAGEFATKPSGDVCLPLNLENIRTKKILELLNFKNFKTLVVTGDVVVAVCNNVEDAKNSVWFTIQKLRKILKESQRLK